MSIEPQKRPVTRRHRLSSKNQLQGWFEKGITWLDAHECDLGLDKVVEDFHVGARRSLQCRRGPAVPERDLQKMDRWKSLYDMVFQTLEDACGQFFAPFPMIKKRHVAGNTGCRSMGAFRAPPLLLLLLLLGSPFEIQEFLLSYSSFSPVGGCLIINFSISQHHDLWIHSNASAAVGFQLMVTTPAVMCFEFDGNPRRTTLNACVVQPSQPASVF